MYRAVRILFVVGLCIGVLAPGGCAGRGLPANPQARTDRSRSTLSSEDDAFLEDLSKRSFMFFWEQADPDTGIVRDRARTDGSPVDGNSRDVGSIASVGFGLTGLCIGSQRGWVTRTAAIDRTRITLHFFAERIEHQHGWFFHFINIRTGAREWASELSSIDTALFLAGVMTVRQCFASDAEIPRLADTIYRRVDFPWMLNGNPALLSMGWKPESRFIDARWDHYCELMVLYLLAISSPTHPIPSDAWHEWSRPTIHFEGYVYVGAADPLFVHQYSHAWIDFRDRVEDRPPHINWWRNSIVATRAHKAFCLSLASRFPGYTDRIWGITASDGPGGYQVWGGPPAQGPIDGTVVPAAAGGSLMFAPDISLPALQAMREQFGDRIYGRYGFADAFRPTDGWVNPDVIGIDLGIMLLSAENLRTGLVWEWFMSNGVIPAAMDRVGFVLQFTPATPSPSGTSPR